MLRFRALPKRWIRITAPVLAVARLHLRAIAHFGVWLELEGAALETIDEETVAALDRHRPRCRCPHTSRDRGRHVLSCVRVFLCHLREQRIVETPAPPEPSLLVREFLDWMSAQRGVVDTTLTSYRRYVTHLVDFLGDDPRTYTAHDLRNFVAERYRHYGRKSIRLAWPRCGCFCATWPWKVSAVRGLNKP